MESSDFHPPNIFYLLTGTKHEIPKFSDQKKLPPRSPVHTFIHTYIHNRFSHVQFFATVWTIAYQASLSVGFSRLGYWSGLPFPSPGDLPNPGIEPMSPVAPAL